MSFVTGESKGNWLHKGEIGAQGSNRHWRGRLCLSCLHLPNPPSIGTSWDCEALLRSEADQIYPGPLGFSQSSWTSPD